MFNRRFATLSVATATLAVGLGVAALDAHAGVQTPSGAISAAPVATQAATVHGSLAASRFWGQQAGQSCAPNAARVLVDVVAGHRVSEKRVEKAAAQWADFDPANGTTWERMPQLVGMFGVASNVHDGASMNDLRTALDTQDVAVVMLDANIVWEMFGLWGGPGTATHAVAVAQIDDAHHLVTLVDSAWPGGATETVPAAVFMTAWDAVGNSALIAE